MTMQLNQNWNISTNIQRISNIMSHGSPFSGFRAVRLLADKEARQRQQVSETLLCERANKRIHYH
jgi:hypothetical protein